MTRPLPRAFGFDVFGTVVDWRGGVIRDAAVFLAHIGRTDVDPAGFADAWRRRYLDTMRAYATSGRNFVTLDVLHREMLDETLRAIAVDPDALDESLVADLNRSWHRLDPWPDAVAGIARLKTLCPVVTLTNGNIALMLAMARRGGLPWDALLGAEVTRVYKPDPAAYLRTAAILGLAPSDLCLVASHHADLAAARACGLATAYVARPMEFGGAPAPDASARQVWDWSCEGIDDLADQMGC
ncbi:haloacid dehalogenase [Sphingomonas sp. Leaf17]|uniref:haloacid dehalogenase type II n=1 Tax=Sphingomonas sp. Leaf17 TaxID=1735683 RepID=UPI0006FA14DF|nr:haloacid dehalogenase type II [Sphingomonas sp. Leaf17]KQM67843.1 haloacid dehalogenase [Sphingomonas sp. Leaf17]